MKRWRILVIFVLACLGGGCGSSTGELEDYYGSRQPTRGGDVSVNGTGVLARMYEAQGASVLSVRRLSPRVFDADTIVWFVDNGELPSQSVINWFDYWLSAQPNRTLVIVPRDFDAAPLYWRKVQSQATATQRPIVQTKLNDAQSKFLAERAMLPAGVSDWEWFQYDSTYNPRTVTTLRGDPQWTAGVNPANLEIELTGRILPDYALDDVLLASGPDAIVTRRDVHLGQVIVVANGSFLLNLPLVNKEHRKLAGALINESLQGDRVVFLEAGGDVDVGDDTAQGLPSIWRFLNTEPLSYLLRSVIFFSLVLIFAMWPIFGVAREESRHHLMDFGRHIEALGKLLARTRNPRYAWNRLGLYRQLTGESTRRSGEQAEPPSGKQPTGLGAPVVDTPATDTRNADTRAADTQATGIPPQAAPGSEIPAPPEGGRWPQG